MQSSLLPSPQASAVQLSSINGSPKFQPCPRQPHVEVQCAFARLDAVPSTSAHTHLVLRCTFGLDANSVARPQWDQPLQAVTPSKANSPIPTSPSETSFPPPGHDSTARHILLVDDHPITREGVAAIVQRTPDLKICCQASTPAEAISLLQNGNADLMITDLNLPRAGGLQLIKEVHTQFPHVRILVLSMHDEALYAERSLRAGAQGYLMKNNCVSRLVDAIRVLLNGGSYVSPEMSKRMLESLSGKRSPGTHSPIQSLSDREFEVFCLFGQGMSTKEAAEALGISPKTVDIFRSRIKKKLNLKDAASLIHHAVRWVASGNLDP